MHTELDELLVQEHESPNVSDVAMPVLNKTPEVTHVKVKCPTFCLILTFLISFLAFISGLVTISLICITSLMCHVINNGYVDT